MPRTAPASAVQFTVSPVVEGVISWATFRAIGVVEIATRKHLCTDRRVVVARGDHHHHGILEDVGASSFWLDPSHLFRIDDPVTQRPQSPRILLQGAGHGHCRRSCRGRPRAAIPPLGWRTTARGTGGFGGAADLLDLRSEARSAGRLVSATALVRSAHDQYRGLPRARRPRTCRVRTAVTSHSGPSTNRRLVTSCCIGGGSDRLRCGSTEPTPVAASRMEYKR